MTVSRFFIVIIVCAFSALFLLSLNGKNDWLIAQDESGQSRGGNPVQPSPDETAEVEEEATDDDPVWGVIKGRIVVTGKVPVAIAIDPEGKDADFCGATKPMMPQDLVVSDDGGLKNVALFLYQSKKFNQKPDIHPMYAKQAKDQTTIEIVNCMFVPHVKFVRTSQTLLVKNRDSKGHNVQHISPRNGFSPLVGIAKKEEIDLNGPERFPTRLTCNIHPWMKSYLLVRDEPYVAISDKDGNFLIENMPAGEWKFQFWHESCGYMSDLQKEGKPVMEGRPSMVTFNVKNGETIDLGEMSIAVGKLRDD